MIRGINVGGHRAVRMDGLRALFEGLGLRNPVTYLQSGNVVFQSPDPGEDGHALAIERCLREECGLKVAVAVRSSNAMTRVLRANPIAGRPGIDPRFLHATFLIHPDGRPSLEGIGIPLGAGEEAVIVDSVIYVYCPNGYGTTKINNGFFERKLSARATTRNWQTVTALEQMARGGHKG